MAHFQLDSNFGDSPASSAGFTVLFWRKSGRVGRERGVTVMPAKYRQGDDLLRMLAPICVRDSGVFLTDKSRLPGPTIVCRNENGVRKN